MTGANNLSKLVSLRRAWLALRGYSAAFVWVNVVRCHLKQTGNVELARQ
jgi:hypothetical protein